MKLAIFDLDNTLLAGDSDYLWGQFLIEKGLVDGNWYRQENDRYYRQYSEGTLDILEFLAFALQPLTRHDMESLQAMHAEYMEQKIIPVMQKSAFDLINKHKAANDYTLIITATNRFVTEPIAKRFGVDTLLATDPEIVNNRYTGKVAGIPCYREGKVTRLNHWMKESGRTLDGSWFYSDSHNDIPLLNLVDNPVAVDPDDQLTKHAQQNHWQIISLREKS